MGYLGKIFTIILSLNHFDISVDINCCKESIGMATAVEIAKDVFNKLDSKQKYRLAFAAKDSADIKSWLKIDLMAPTGEKNDSEPLALEIANQLLSRLKPVLV